MKCNNCGKEVEEGYKYCIYCGSEIVAKEVAEETVSSNNETEVVKNTPNIKVIGFIVGGVVGLAAIATIVYFVFFRGGVLNNKTTTDTIDNGKNTSEVTNYEKIEIKDVESFYSEENYESANEAQKRYSDFGFNLLRNAADNNENEIISPYSLFNSLALLANGADGETRKQFETVMNMTVEDMNSYLRDNNRNSEQYKMADGIWFNTKQGLKLNNDYEQIANEYYNSSAVNKDFDGNVASEINNWASEKTGGSIDNVISPGDVDDSTSFFIVNALATGGKWYFDESKTNRQVFNNYDGTQAKTDFMNDTISNWWHDDYSEGFSIMLDNYTSMVGILPNEGLDVYDYLNLSNGEVFENFLKSEIYYDNIDEAKGEADIHRTILSFPKFEYTKEYDLKDALSKMGLSDIFDHNNCDFSKLASGSQELVDMLQVDKVKQKADIYVDEKEVRASAVTVVEGGMGAAGYEIRNIIDHNVVFNRPFIFAIITSDRTPLFIGVVTNFEDKGGEVTSVKKVRVIADVIKIRNYPGLSGEKVGKVKKGETLSYKSTVDSDGYTWYEIGDNEWVADSNGEWLERIE